MKSEASAVKEEASPRATPARPAIVVTGASSGIGRALALEAAREGEVVLVARSRDALEALAAEIVAAGGRAHVLVLDLTGHGVAEALRAELERLGLFCDVLVNNAGYGLIGAAGELDAADQLGIIDINVRALTELALAQVPGQIARGRGGVLNVASIAGFLPGPRMAVYYASKAFVRSFSEALWEECRRSGVTVTALCPGPVSTGFFARATGGGRKPALFRMVPSLGPADVARQGWRGFRAGQRLVIPGLGNRLVTWLVPLMPTRLVLALVHRLQKGRAPGP